MMSMISREETQFGEKLKGMEQVYTMEYFQDQKHVSLLFARNKFTSIHRSYMEYVRTAVVWSIF